MSNGQTFYFQADIKMMPKFTVPELALLHIKVHEDDKSEKIKHGT